MKCFQTQPSIREEDVQKNSGDPPRSNAASFNSAAKRPAVTAVTPARAMARPPPRSISSPTSSSQPGHLSSRHLAAGGKGEKGAKPDLGHLYAYL